MNALLLISMVANIATACFTHADYKAGKVPTKLCRTITVLCAIIFVMQAIVLLWQVDLH